MPIKCSVLNKALVSFLCFGFGLSYLCAASVREIQTSRYHTVGRAMSFVADFLQEANDIDSCFLVLRKHLSQPLPSLEGLQIAVPDFVWSRVSVCWTQVIHFTDCRIQCETVVSISVKTQ